MSIRKRTLWLVVALMIPWCVAAWLSLSPGSCVFAADAGAPKYPRVDMCISYAVDPNWPQRPAGVGWGAMSGVAVDPQDNVWIFTRAKPPVQVYDSAGKYVRGWGADFVDKAHHIKIDGQGNVWLADVGSHVIMQCSPEGKLLRTLGTRGVPGEDATHFSLPTDMAISPTGDVFVSDGYGNGRVVHYNKDGKFVKAWGKLGTGPGEFSIAHAIVLDREGRLYVADRNNARVQVFDQEGTLLDEWRNLVVPWGLWVGRANEIWVCGSSPMIWRDTDGSLGCPPKDQVFVRFAPSGRLMQIWTVPKGEDGKERPGECNWLHAIALDSHGNIYAGDIKGSRVQKFVRKN